MRKIVWLACLVMCTIGTANAQEISASFGYATFSMGDFKDFNKELASQSPLPSRVTNNFPGYLNAEISFTYPLINEQWLTGIYAGFTSTGSRIAYNDYSGHQYIDQQLMALSLGLQGQFPFNPDDKSIFGIKLKAGIVSTFHTLESEVVIYSNSSSDNIKFRSVNVSLEPVIYFKRQLFGRFSLQADAGYAAHVVKGELYLKGDSDAYLTDDAGDPIRADWSGLRVSLGLVYRLSMN